MKPQKKNQVLRGGGENGYQCTLCDSTYFPWGVYSAWDPLLKGGGGGGGIVKKVKIAKNQADRH